MVYKAIGLMSNSFLNGLDMVYTHLHETAGKWTYEMVQTDCIPYSSEWREKLARSVQLSAQEYQLLHAEFGRYIGEQVNHFIGQHNLHHQVHLVASHGHTSFHLPDQKMTAQLGDGAAIAAITGLPVVSDLQAIDIALGGQGGPINTIAEKLLSDAEEKQANHKDALVVALMGVLRWREEYNMLSSATGAQRNSVGGALWLGGEA